jgi:hypothetical protein
LIQLNPSWYSLYVAFSISLPSYGPCISMGYTYVFLTNHTYTKSVKDSYSTNQQIEIKDICPILFK